VYDKVSLRQQGVGMPFFMYGTNSVPCNSMSFSASSPTGCEAQLCVGCKKKNPFFRLIVNCIVYRTKNGCGKNIAFIMMKKV
jgi:hypothetical protein